MSKKVTSFIYIAFLTYAVYGEEIDVNDMQNFFNKLENVRAYTQDMLRGMEYIDRILMSKSAVNIVNEIESLFYMNYTGNELGTQLCEKIAIDNKNCFNGDPASKDTITNVCLRFESKITGDLNECSNFTMIFYSVLNHLVEYGKFVNESHYLMNNFDRYVTDYETDPDVTDETYEVVQLLGNVGYGAINETLTASLYALTLLPKTLSSSLDDCLKIDPSNNMNINIFMNDENKFCIRMLVINR